MIINFSLSCCYVVIDTCVSTLCYLLYYLSKVLEGIHRVDLFLAYFLSLSKEPLTHVLWKTWLCPLVFINIKGFFLWFTLFFRRWSFSFLSFCWFWLLFFRRWFQLHLFFLTFSLFFLPNGKIPNRTDILLNFMEILRCQVVILRIVGNDNVSIFTQSDSNSNIFQTLPSDVVVSHIVSDRNVLEESCLVGLNQEDSWSQDIINKFFCNYELSVEFDLIESA